MRRHPEFAFDMISPISYLRLALDIPYGHHERWDGSVIHAIYRRTDPPGGANISVVDVGMP